MCCIWLPLPLVESILIHPKQSISHLTWHLSCSICTLTSPQKSDFVNALVAGPDTLPAPYTSISLTLSSHLHLWA